MELYRKYVLDLNTERRRILEPGVYTKKEQQKLLKLVDLVEKFEFGKAVKYFTALDRQFREYIGIELDEFLTELTIEAYTSLTRDGSDEKLPLTTFMRQTDSGLVPILHRSK